MAEPTGPSTLVAVTPQPAKVVTNLFGPGIKAAVRMGIFIVAVVDTESMTFVAVNVATYDVDVDELFIWIVNETVFVAGFIPLALKLVEGLPAIV